MKLIIPFIVLFVGFSGIGYFATTGMGIIAGFVGVVTLVTFTLSGFWAFKPKPTA